MATETEEEKIAVQYTEQLRRLTIHDTQFIENAGKDVA